MEQQSLPRRTDNPDGEARRPSSDVFLAAVEASRLPMVLSDPNRAECPIVFCNNAFCELTGYALSEVLGRNCRFLQGPATDPAAVQSIREGLRDRRELHVELFNYRKDGYGFWNALYISPVFAADGSLLYFFGSQLDVSRRRETEALLQQSQRMETLGTMAAGIAHEFNNLMTVVIGSIERAAERSVDDRQREQLRRADLGATRASRLTAQMLSFARRQYLEPGVFDLNRLVREFDTVLTQAAGDNNQVTLDLAKGELLVKVDRGEFELALVGVVRNAGDAMPDGGRVVIATCPPTRHEKMIELSVSDNGTGMSPETMTHAAEPFFTTKQAGHGFGLGLSMAHGFVGQSGGRMKIQSALECGTSVRMFFPEAGG